MTNIFKMKPEEEKENDFDCGFKIPDTKSVLSSLTEQLQKDHQAQSEEEEKNGTKNKRQQKRGGTICMCEEPNCRIGPMIERK